VIGDRRNRDMASSKPDGLVSIAKSAESEV
jgi:hypothetical protein